MEKCCAFQPYKRQRYLDIAGELGCDWLIVIDTDEYIHHDFQDWECFWWALQVMSVKYPDYRLFKIKMWMPPEWKKAHNIVRTNVWKPWIRIHKNPGEQRYCMDYHYYWCPKNVTDEQLCKGEPLMYKPFKNAIDCVRFSCDSLLRTPERLKASDEWAFRNIHDERRRLYYKNADYLYKQKHDPLKENELFHYAKNGKILRKNIINNQ